MLGQQPTHQKYDGIISSISSIYRIKIHDGECLWLPETEWSPETIKAYKDAMHGKKLNLFEPPTYLNHLVKKPRVEKIRYSSEQDGNIRGFAEIQIFPGKFRKAILLPCDITASYVAPTHYHFLISMCMRVFDCDLVRVPNFTSQTDDHKRSEAVPDQIRQALTINEGMRPILFSFDDFSRDSWQKTGAFKRHEIKLLHLPNKKSRLTNNGRRLSNVKTN